MVEPGFEHRTPHWLPSQWSFSFQVNGVTTDWHTPLFNACVSGSESCVDLLLRFGASPHPASDLASPIHEAAKRGKVVENWSFPTTPSRDLTVKTKKEAEFYFRAIVLKVGPWDQRYQCNLARECRFLAFAPDLLSQQLWAWGPATCVLIHNPSRLFWWTEHFRITFLEHPKCCSQDLSLVRL